jgi:hypothetical protein
MLVITIHTCIYIYIAIKILIFSGKMLHVIFKLGIMHPAAPKYDDINVY